MDYLLLKLYIREYRVGSHIEKISQQNKMESAEMYWHIFSINVWPGDSQVLQQISQQEQFIRCWRSLPRSWPMYRMWRLRWVHRQGGLADELHPRDGTGERSYGDVEGLGFPENMVIQAYFTWEIKGEFGCQLPPPTSELWWHGELCWEARTPTAPTLSSTLQKFYARYL